MSKEKQIEAGVRIDGDKRCDLNKEQVAGRMAGVVKPPRTDEQIRTTNKARRQADERARRQTAKLQRDDGGKEGTKLTKVKVKISAERSERQTIRCRPGTWHGMPDGRVAAIDVLNAASFELGKMPLSRLIDYCVNGLTSAEIARKHGQKERDMAPVLHQDLRACAMHFLYL